MERHICIHCHFYQPPRENPWLEAIELQDSAHPYHDWNERITAECYAPNATSRILDEQGRIVQIVNNYKKVSFDMGPTLLAWLEDSAPDVYAAVLEADRESQKVCSGHGSALAQAYNHMILPLSSRGDKYTQILWGIRDFESRFGRSPEGMWLPETAVDLESLDILAEMGIRFTILAPRQAKKVRSLNQKKWLDVRGEKIDPTTPYTLDLPSGRSISLFFYDGPVSRAVAFEQLLTHGETFAQRLLGGFSEGLNRPQIVHIATDGESYGHHHRYGDMALAYAIHYIESRNLAQFINYGLYLEKYPPAHAVKIFENSSWSCVHGVERWKADCGCNSGGHPGWNQAWRAPLREALDWLRDTMAPAYEEKARSFLKDPWQARNEYIHVILDRSNESIEAFLQSQALRPLGETEKITVLKLMELQRHAMLMYTSCGWFFDELSGIETVQVIQYAARALQLAQEVLGDATEQRFVELLAKAKSNVSEFGNGRLIYEKFVRPAMIDLPKVCAHYAVSSPFEDYGEEVRISCYKVEQQDYRIAEAGRSKLVWGRAAVKSEITLNSAVLAFCVLHFGDHNLTAGVEEYRPEDGFPGFIEQITRAFNSGDLTEAIRRIDERFGESTYSLRTLFRDEQRKVLDVILESTLSDAEALYRQIYEHNAFFMRFLKDMGNPAPKALYTAAGFVLNASLRRALEDEGFNLETIHHLLNETKLQGISLDSESLEMPLRKRIEEKAEAFHAAPHDQPLLEELEATLGILDLLPFQVNLRRAQNLCYDVLTSIYPQMREKSAHGEVDAEAWTSHFLAVCEKLSIGVSG